MEERLPDQPVSPIADQPSDIAWGFLGDVLCGANHLGRLHERSGTADTALSETSPDPRSSPEIGQLAARPTFLPRTGNSSLSPGNGR
jgi:hypothetical protein